MAIIILGAIFVVVYGFIAHNVDKELDKTLVGIGGKTRRIQ